MFAALREAVILSSADPVQANPSPDSEIQASPDSVALAPAGESSLEVNPKASKDAVRRSLYASTVDGVFATLFSNTTGGALLSSFLLELGAGSTEIGLLAAIPMLANLLQPIGAYFSELAVSRRLYCLWIYGISRLLWVVLVISIGWATWQHLDPHWLLVGTLCIVAASHLLGALGSAAWLSWMAVLVPRRLRGRYFGFRNSAANLTSLISIPLMGVLVSQWYGGSIQGYGIVLSFGIVTGLISLAFQGSMVDVNPQVQKVLPPPPSEPSGSPAATSVRSSLWAFLIYFVLWTFAVNLSAPFFNLYLLDSLEFNISQVTLYNSLSAGANLLLLMLWGKLADRFGNRPILLVIGILVAATPIMWLGTGADFWSIWLWFPLLHLLSGATWAAIELCSSNLLISITPIQGQSTYFGVFAAVAGSSGALGTITGGVLAQMQNTGGILGLFALSSVLRLFALLPLVFVHERHGQPLSQIMRLLFPSVERST